MLRQENSKSYWNPYGAIPMPYEQQNLSFMACVIFLLTNEPKGRNYSPESCVKIKEHPDPILLE